jgi:hypothetical protein
VTAQAPADDAQLKARRAVEALRSGVPSRDAVAALGSGQTDIEDRFVHLLDGLGTVRTRSRGLLLGGGFGAGKSHLLEHLAHLALESNCVVSRIVVSKETPLHDPVKMLRAAVESAITPDGAIGAVADAASRLDPGSPAYAELLAWAGGSGASVEEWFPLTVTLLGRVQGAEDDFGEAIVRFWSGEPLPAADLRRHVKAAGLPRPTLTRVPPRELAAQRLRFLARLFVAAGYSGWVVLLDEVELIARYSPLQRGRCYAALAGWLAPDPEDRAAPLMTIAAMTDDFDAAVLTERDDRNQIPQRLRAKGTGEWDEIAARAEVGMRMIERDAIVLHPPGPGELDEIYARLRTLHSEAFAWHAPDVPGLERLGTTRMRQYVRAWINEWDLVRIDPTYRPDTQLVEIRIDYAEQAELEHETDVLNPN